MIRIDNRTGSKELERYFKEYGLVPQLEKLEAGDFAFSGKGPEDCNGRPTICEVAIERKRIDSDDFVDSMTTKRLAGSQLHRLASNYDYCYLIVEGFWKPGPNGEVMIRDGKDWRPRGISWAALDGYMDSLTLRGGIVCIRTSTKEETVAAVVNRYKRWQKEWSEHRSHDVIYAPTNEGMGRPTLLPRKISIVEKMACQIPGFEHKARWVAQHFKTCADMCRAGEAQWSSVIWKDRKGNERKISKAIAAKIVATLRAELTDGKDLECLNGGDT